jgi:anti-sigma B factor antagonist
MNLSLNTRHNGDGATVEVGGEIDLGSGERLLEYALEVMREQGPCLAVNLADVTFLDCGGLRVLLALRSRARLLGGHLDVVSASAPVRRVLGILALDTVFSDPDPSEVDDLYSEELQRWHCFRPVKAGAPSRPGPFRFVRSRTCTTGWASC